MADKIYVGGPNGLVEKYDTEAETWSDMTIPGMTGQTPKRIIPLAEDDIWVSFTQTAATTFKLAHWDGDSWTVYTSPTTALAVDTMIAVAIPGDGLYVYATRIYHNSFANYIYRVTFAGAFTLKWAGNPGAFQVSFVDFHGLAGNDLYLAGVAGWPVHDVYIWHWTGSGDPSPELPGNMSPALPLYPPSYVESYWGVHFIRCVTADLVVAGFRYNAGVSPLHRIYAGKFGSTWTQELLLSEGEPDYEDVKALYYNHADADGSKMFFYTEKYQDPTIRWMRVRSAAGVWTRIPMHDGLVSIQSGYGCAGSGEIMVHVGGGASGYRDAVLTQDGGDTLEGWDRVATFYQCAAIYREYVEPPHPLENPSFEIPDVAEGQALYWDEGYDEAGEDVAMFWEGSRGVPMESFEGAWWDNDLAQQVFGDGDLEAGMFEQGHLDHEPFEFSWASPETGPPWNHQGIESFTAENIQVGQFDSASEDFEDFENGWDDNEDSIEEFTAGDIAVGMFDSGAEAFENFENLWKDNEDSISGFSDPDPTHLTVGQFGVSPDNFEDFDEWTTTLP